MSLEFADVPAFTPVSGESFGILDAIEIDAVSNASCKLRTLGRC